MKKVLSTVVAFLILNYYCRGQDSTYNNFITLVNKVQDEKLTGTFMYKGYIVNIGEYTEYKTAIGKFMKISWMDSNTTLNNDLNAPYIAIYHNTMGYMTKNLFGQYKRVYKDYKVDKDKYCRETQCVSLIEGSKKPYILMNQRTKTDIPVIK